jgi:adenylyltransferase/sulfurtransferase
MSDDSLARYAKQMLFREIGRDGQVALSHARVLLVGCGALGSVIAELLVRAGVGMLRIADRDFVDLTNLQRQVLFNEDDVRDHLPKVIAAVQKLSRINHHVQLETHVVDVQASNILELAHGVDLIMDGTDNFETRFLINDVSLELHIPWVHGGCLAANGQVMSIIPHQSACYRCLTPDLPDASAMPTCDTAGVIGPAVNVVASMQVTQALKILTQPRDQWPMSKLLVLDLWNFEFRQLDLSSLYARKSCPACHGGERAWLSGQKGSHTTILCGRNAIQISPSTASKRDLKLLAEKLTGLGEILLSPYLLKFTPRDEAYILTIFSDSRAIIQGTEDAAQAKTIYARYVGQ